MEKGSKKIRVKLKMKQKKEDETFEKNISITRADALHGTDVVHGAGGLQCPCCP